MAETIQATTGDRNAGDGVPRGNRSVNQSDGYGPMDRGTHYVGRVGVAPSGAAPSRASWPPLRSDADAMALVLPCARGLAAASRRIPAWIPRAWIRHTPARALADFVRTDSAYFFLSILSSRPKYVAILFSNEGGNHSAPIKGRLLVVQTEGAENGQSNPRPELALEPTQCIGGFCRRIVLFWPLEAAYGNGRCVVVALHPPKYACALRRQLPSTDVEGCCNRGVGAAASCVTRRRRLASPLPLLS